MAVVHLDRGVNYLTPERLESGEGALLIGPHEAAVADHIGGEDRRKLALKAPRRHQSPSFA
jgi:hypothetical protein